MLEFFWVKFSQIWPGASPGAKVSSKNLKKIVEFVREPEWNNVPNLVIIAMLDFFWVEFSEIWPGTSPGAKVSSQNLKNFMEFVKELEWSNVPNLGDHRNARLLLGQILSNLTRGLPRSQSII
jgi:hypothetical protein